MRDFAGKVAVVTGGTRGIGQAISIALKNKGFRVAANYGGNDEAAQKFKSETGIAVYKWDVSSFDACAAGIKQVEADLGPIEVLVNNAGIAVAKPFVDTTLEEWDRTFATNVRGLYLLTRGVLPGMKTLGRGDIINIASLAGKNGIANAVAYSASKHAVMGFSRSLMLEVRKDGIRVITICPGSVDTPLLRNATAFSPAFDRILKAEDVAETVVDALKLPRRAMVSELEIRPSNP